MLNSSRYFLSFGSLISKYDHCSSLHFECEKNNKSYKSNNHWIFYFILWQWQNIFTAVPMMKYLLLLRNDGLFS